MFFFSKLRFLFIWGNASLPRNRISALFFFYFSPLSIDTKHFFFKFVFNILFCHNKLFSVHAKKREKKNYFWWFRARIHVHVTQNVADNTICHLFDSKSVWERKEEKNVLKSLRNKKQNDKIHSKKFMKNELWTFFFCCQFRFVLKYFFFIFFTHAPSVSSRKLMFFPLNIFLFIR